MKHLITATVILCFVSCQKEIMVSNSVYSDNGDAFFQKIKGQLGDSLSSEDYVSVDFNRFYKSKDAQGEGYFVRGAFQKEELETDFILLRTDSLGNISEGKMIHVDKEKSSTEGNNHLFKGEITISSLNRQQWVIRKVIDGRWADESGMPSLLEQEAPVGEQVLPEVVVTSTTYDGGGSNWYWFGGFFDDYSYSTGGGGGYTYGSSTGGGNESSNDDEVTEDNIIVIEIEPNDEPPIRIEDYLKCFSTISDINASYQLTLYADIPVNGDPSELFNTATGGVGHSFIQLRKSSGNSSLQQNIGFYPQTGWKSLSSSSVTSKMVDNADHEFNASLTASVSSTEFQSALTEIQTLAAKDYNIETWNCTDFALAVFNAANTGETLTIPKYFIPGTDSYSNTPQGLYTTMESMKSNGNDSYGNIDIPGICGYVGDSHGTCGN